MLVKNPLLLLLLTGVLCMPCIHSLQHSAMWGLRPGSSGTQGDTPGGSFADLTFDDNNITRIIENWKRFQVRALYPLSWTASQLQKCHAPVHHQCTHPPSCDFPCITIAPDYEASFKKQFALMQPAIAAGALKGIFLGDEHVYFGVTLDEVKKIADLIRTAWPDAVIYMNEAPDIAMCNYDKQNRTVFAEGQCLPQNVDWFGWDFYQYDSLSWTAFEEAAKGMMYPRFSRPDQRLVPTSLGFNGGSMDAEQAAKLDTFCATNARHFLKWGLEDNRLVGLFPFHWNGGTRNKNGSISGDVGIIDLPKCAATYRAIGELIIAAGAQGTSLDPVLRPPTPAADGTFPEPTCLSPTQPPPSVWSWCDRTNPTRLVRRGTGE